MYEITKKEYLSKTSVLMNVKAPLVAAKAEAGQFIILRSDKDGERLPFTIADSDRETGEISIVFQAEGSSTKKLALYEKGDFLEDFVGPLGKPAQLEGLEKALIVCGDGRGKRLSRHQKAVWFGLRHRRRARIQNPRQSDA